MSVENEEKKVPVNVYELLDRVTQQQEQQGKQLELLAKAVAALADRIQQPQAQQQGTEFLKLIAGMLGGGEQKATIDVKRFTETAAYFARLADVLGHYRNPTLPYSPADKFLMKQGAIRSYEMRYHGVKSDKTAEKEELPSDEQLDKMLGFTQEVKEEKKEERKEGHAI